MRKLIAITAAVLSIGVAHADTEFSMPNKAGGEIRLTSAQCPGKGKEKWSVMYAFSPSGLATYGCWFFGNNVVHVAWEDGTHSIFQASSFSPVQSNKPSKGVQL